MRYAKHFLVMGFAAAIAMGAAWADERPRGTVVVHDDGGKVYTRSFACGDCDARGFLGVHLDDADDGGALIVHVMDDTGADDAGLRDGDVIVGVNGEEIRHARDLSRKIRDALPGDQVELEVLRDGKTQTLTAELGEHPRSFAFSFGGDEDGFVFDTEEFAEHMAEMKERLGDMDFDVPNFSFSFGGHSRPRLGIQAVQPTAELRAFMGGPEDAGILVGKIMEGTPAEEAGLQVGDLIVTADGVTVEDTGDLVRALSRKDGENITLEIVRDGRTMTLDAFIPEREEKPRYHEPSRGHEWKYRGAAQSPRT